MNISSKPEHELLYIEKQSHGYEWWHFDALSVNKEWAISVTFFHGNPFSGNYLSSKYSDKPEDHPAIRISIHRNGAAEFVGFQEYSGAHFIWQNEDAMSCIVGSSSFKRQDVGDDVEYELQLNQLLDSGHSVTGKLKFLSPKLPSKLLSKKEGNEKHFWNVLQPRAKVVGTIKLKGRTDNFHIGFHGQGFHDHWVGQEKLGNSFQDWYRGHVHFERETLLYTLADKYGEKQHEAWLIDRENEKITGYFDEITFHKPVKSGYGSKFFSEIHLSGVMGKIIIRQKKKLDGGPFSIRFLAEASWSEETDAPFTLGITEYMEPRWFEGDRFQQKAQRKIRNMRQKASWIQRSKLFYELTW